MAAVVPDKKRIKAFASRKVLEAAAYAPMRAASADKLPRDLREAIRADSRAKKTLATLNRANLFARAFRINNMKTAAGRARKIESLVTMLARGETILLKKRPSSH